EAILFLGGLGDDALVIGWLSVTIINATDDFLDWERNRTAYRGQVVNDEAYADPRARGPRTGGGGTRDGRTPHYAVVRRPRRPSAAWPPAKADCLPRGAHRTIAGSADRAR